MHYRLALRCHKLIFMFMINLLTSLSAHYLSCKVVFDFTLIDNIVLLFYWIKTIGIGRSVSVLKSGIRLFIKYLMLILIIFRLGL